MNTAFFSSSWILVKCCRLVDMSFNALQQTANTILLDTDVNKYSLMTARWQTNWIHLDLFLGIEQRTVGCLGTTNQNKAVVRGLVSQPITAYVSHLGWQRLVATLAVVICGSNNTNRNAHLLPRYANYLMHLLHKHTNAVIHCLKADWIWNYKISTNIMVMCFERQCIMTGHDKYNIHNPRLLMLPLWDWSHYSSNANCNPAD